MVREPERSGRAAGSIGEAIMGEDGQKTGEREALKSGRIADEADTEGHAIKPRGLTVDEEDEAPGSSEVIRSGRVTADDDGEVNARRS